MIENQASTTAQGAATHRATHQLLDRPLVFEDPLALRIIGAEAEAELRSGRSRYTDPRIARLRAFLAVRSRFTEDCLAAAGVPQYVLLGAGLDTYAYRSDLRRLAVFEIDHPATQEWKRDRLHDVGITIPETVVFAPVDFERETVQDGLSRAGFDFVKPTVVAWLGVVPYLSKDAVIETLRILAKTLAAGSQIIFDYPSPPDELSVEERRTAIAFAARVAAAEEPLRTIFNPQELQVELATAGLQAEDFNHATLSGRYLIGRADGLALSRHAHIMRASIKS